MLKSRRKDIPANLRNQQNEVKDLTVEKIQDAINLLKEEGYLVDIKALMERTGFSYSLFTNKKKSHVQNVLELNKVGKYAKKTVYTSETNVHKKVIQLESELQSMINKVLSLEKKLSEKKETIRNLRDKLEESENECSILRGELQRVVSIATIHGIELN